MENQKAKKWIEEQDFLWLSVTETERLIKAYEAGQKDSEAQMKCCGNCRFSESDKLNGTFCHREGCFVVASAKCKLWEN